MIGESAFEYEEDIGELVQQTWTVSGRKPDWAALFELHTPPVEDLSNISNMGSVNS